MNDKLMQEISQSLKGYTEENKVSEQLEYRIINDRGELFSQFLGWVQLKGNRKNIYGHNFNKYEAEIVMPILNKYGYHNLKLKKDFVATALNYVL